MESGGNGYLFSGDKKKRYYDFTLLFMVIALMLVGILMIASISPYNAAKYLGNSTFYTSRQIRYVIIGVAGMIGISLVDYRLYAMETPRRSCLPTLSSWHWKSQLSPWDEPTRN